MSAEQITSLMRRKAQSGKHDQAARSMSLARALRLTFARQADKMMELPLSVIGLTQSVQEGPTLKDALDPDALLMMLEGTAGRDGLVTLSPDLVAGLIQQQTMGRVLPRKEGAAPRPHTPTDAALCAPFIEAVLNQSATLPDLQSDKNLLTGYRYGVQAETPRIAGLMLDAPKYQCVNLTLDLAGGDGGGTLMLFLPPPPVLPQVAEDGDTKETGELTAPPTLAAQALDLHAELTVALTTLTLPLSEITKMEPGDVIDLDLTTLSQAQVLDANGRQVSRGNLGQLDGMRALQLQQKAKPHIHPRRRVSDREELDLPDIGVPDDIAPPTDIMPSQPMSLEQEPSIDVFGDGGDLPDLSDLDLGTNDLPDLEDLQDDPFDRRQAG